LIILIDQQKEEIMVPGLALILAALVSLSGDFHNGVRELEKGNPDKAVALLTKVIYAKGGVTDLHELALLHRAEAYAKLKKTDMALTDLSTLVHLTKNADRRKKAIAQYKKAGGRLSRLLPKHSPTQTLNVLAQAIEDEDFKKARKYIGGEIEVMLNTADKVYQAMEGGSILEEMASEVEDMIVVSSEIDTNTATATAVIEWDAIFTVGLTMVDHHWQLDNLIHFAEERRGRHEHRGQSSDMSTLSSIGKGLKMYSMDHNEAFPPKLTDLGDYLGDMAVTWTHPKTQKAIPLLYRADLTEASDSSFMHIATPVPVDGKRLVLYLDGSVTHITEKEFTTAATKQGWKLPDLIKKADVSKDIAKDVKELITQLGDASSKVRAGARMRLKKIGADAYPFLKEHTKHKDPEVRAAVKELLGN
jgi:predicted negative regulator of RcsB-dependent stress response